MKIFLLAICAIAEQLHCDRAALNAGWSSQEKVVCLSNACIVTKRKKDWYRFLYYAKNHFALSSKNKMLSYRRETALQGAL